MLKINTVESRFGVFIVEYFYQKSMSSLLPYLTWNIFHTFLVFLLLTLNR